MPRGPRSPCPQPATPTTATCLLWSWSWLAAALCPAGGCLPEEITYRPEDAPSSAASGGGGSGGGQCVDEQPDGGAGGSSGGGGAEPCVRCWAYAVSGEVGLPCTCSADVYEAYKTCICDACPDCTICGGSGSPDDCSSCYEEAAEQSCQATRQACLDD